jgi:hypothetical protein
VAVAVNRGLRCGIRGQGAGARGREDSEEQAGEVMAQFYRAERRARGRREVKRGKGAAAINGGESTVEETVR